MIKWIIPMACAMLLGACTGMSGSGSSGAGDTSGGTSGRSSESESGSSMGSSGSSMGGTGTDTPATTSPTPNSSPGPTTSPSTRPGAAAQRRSPSCGARRLRDSALARHMGRCASSSSSATWHNVCCLHPQGGASRWWAQSALRDCRPLEAIARYVTRRARQRVGGGAVVWGWPMTARQLGGACAGRQPGTLTWLWPAALA